MEKHGSRKMESKFGGPLKRDAEVPGLVFMKSSARVSEPQRSTCGQQPRCPLGRLLPGLKTRTMEVKDA